MNSDLDFELPVCMEPPFPPPRLDNAQYLEFIEFNQDVVREDPNFESLMRNRLRPVEEFFVIP